jgi:hypothetical protein
MRYRSLLLAVSAAAALGATAQAQGFGVKAGMVSSTIKLSGEGSDELGSSLSRRTGKAAGAFVTLGSGRIGLQLEALYTEKGTKFEGDFEGTEASIKLNSAYVELPALIRIGFPGEKIRPYLYAGAAAAMEVKCEGEVDFEGETGTADCDDAEEEADTERRKMDITALGGVGIQFMMGTLNFLVEGRYARGLQNLNKTGEGGAKNEAISVLVGIVIR